MIKKMLKTIGVIFVLFIISGMISQSNSCQSYYILSNC